MLAWIFDECREGRIPRSSTANQACCRVFDLIEHMISDHNAVPAIITAEMCKIAYI